MLLVSTTDDEFVLDNLTPVIAGWGAAPYHWIKRQVNGEAFHWVMVDSSASAKRQPKPLLIAFLR